jgi:hypothetical protein
MGGDMEHLFQLINSFAKRKKFSSDQDREDFIMFAIERKLEGSTASFPNLYVDYFRQEFGRYKKEQVFRRTMQFREIPISDRKWMTEFDDTLRGLEASGDIRVILTLKYLWELKNAEIAFAFGISEAAINSRIQYFLGRLKKSIKDKFKRSSKR